MQLLLQLLVCFALFSANGGLRGWRFQTDSPWSPTALCQTEGQWEKQKAVWTVGCSGIQPGIIKIYIYKSCEISFE